TCTSRPPVTDPGLDERFREKVRQPRGRAPATGSVSQLPMPDSDPGHRWVTTAACDAASLRPVLGLNGMSARVVVLVSALAGGWPSAAAAESDLLPTGRAVEPAGQLTTLRAWPTGAAVTPDGSAVLVIAGSFSTGGAADTTPGGGTQLYVVDARTAVVRQIL